MPPALSSPSPASVLDQIRLALQDKLGAKPYQNWFGGATRLELDCSTLIVYVRSPYLVKWMQKQFHAELLSIGARLVGPDVALRYEVGTAVTLSPDASEVAPHSPPQTSVDRRTAASPPPVSPHGRNRRAYQLSDFVVGDSNELAVAAVHRILETPGSVSPLYLHGHVGNGKTHLIESLRSRLRKEFPTLQVVLLTAEQFGNYFSQALASRSLPSFRGKFRSVDALLLDDVDFLDNKKGFQEEFLHTLKQCEARGAQLVLTANRHPRLLDRTSEELITRFLSGVVCRLESPNEAMRREIVQRHAARMRGKFSSETLDYVAARFTNNVRELEGAVNLLATWSQMTDQRVSVAVARKLLERLEQDCVRLVKVSHVEEAVCELFGVQPEELRSASRKQSLAQPRMLAMYLARKLTQFAYSEIGAHFGGRNHSTVMSAERKVARQIESSDTIRLSAETWTVSDVLKTLEQRIKVG